MKSRYTYKFSDDGYDYFRDNTADKIVKIPDDLTDRTDAHMAKVAVDAENDPAVWEYFS